MCVIDECMIYLIAEMIIIFIVHFRLTIWLDGKYAEIVHDYEGLSVCVYVSMSVYLSVYGVYVYMLVYVCVTVSINKHIYYNRLTFSYY